MENLKIELDYKNNLVHYAIGALIKRNNRYLMIERNTFPEGASIITGHVRENEDPEDALVREVKEEVGLRVDSYDLIYHRSLKSFCNKGVYAHNWSLFSCSASGDVKVDKKEIKDYGWYSIPQIKNMELAQGASTLLRKLGILS